MIIESYRKVGSASPTAETYTTVYTVPLAGQAVVTLNICNRTEDVVRCRVAHVSDVGYADGDVPADADFLAYDTTVLRDIPKQLTGISMFARDKLIVYTDIEGLSFVVSGMEATTEE